MVTEYRRQAKELDGEIENHEGTAKLLMKQARGGYETADRLRSL